MTQTTKPRTDTALGCLVIIIAIAAAIAVLWFLPDAVRKLSALISGAYNTLAIMHPVDRLTVCISLALLLHLDRTRLRMMRCNIANKIKPRTVSEVLREKETHDAPNN